VPGDQRPAGAIESDVSVASQVVTTGTAGTTVSAASTERRTIGVAKRRVTEPSSGSAAGSGANAPLGTGTARPGGVATVAAGARRIDIATRAQAVDVATMAPPSTRARDARPWSARTAWLTMIAARGTARSRNGAPGSLLGVDVPGRTGTGQGRGPAAA
jgi:hypothetical protein